MSISKNNKTENAEDKKKIGGKFIAKKRRSRKKNTLSDFQFVGTGEKSRRSLIRNLTVFSLYIYIASIYVLSYSEKYSSLSRMLFIVLLGFTIMDVIANNIKLYLDTSSILMTLFIAYALISVLWVKSSIGVERSVTIMLHVFPLYYVMRINVRSLKDVRTVFNAIIVGTMIMCVYTLYYYGFGTIFKAMVSGEIRIGNEINQSNAMGIYCAILITILTYYIIYEKKKILLLFMPLAVMIQLACGSRKGLAIMAVGIIIVAFFRAGNKKIVFLIGVAGVLVIAYNLILIFADNNYYFYRITQLFALFTEDGPSIDYSSLVRQRMVHLGITMFSQRPFQGHGPMQFEYMYGMSYGIRRPPHSTYIHILVSYGLIGFSLFYGQYVYFVKNLITNFKKRVPFTPIIIAMIVLLLVNDFGASMINHKYTYILFGLIAGFISILKDSPSYADDDDKMKKSS